MARESIKDDVSALKRELNDLNLLLNKLVATSINVQSKVTESIVKTDDLLKEVKDMVELLQVATEMESGPGEIRGISDMNDSIKTLNKNVESIELHLRKIYRRLFVMSQARTIQKTGFVSRRPSSAKPFSPTQKGLTPKKL